MPFTVTHAAAIVPVAWLCRWRLPLSALAIGSMIPDASVFFPELFSYTATHSLAGIVTHALPLGLIAFYLFHLVLKQPLVDLLPPPLSRRLDGWSRAEVEVHPLRMLIVAGCVVFGALTHVVWDAFTHGAGWGVDLVPSLRHVVMDYQGHTIHVYSLLQHGSSLLFLPPLFVGFVWWTLRQSPSSEPTSERFSMPRSVTWTIAAILVLAGCLYFLSLQADLASRTWVGALAITVKNFGALTGLLLVGYSLCMQVIWMSTKYETRSVEGEA
jgi:hypothetical protein